MSEVKRIEEQARAFYRIEEKAYLLGIDVTQYMLLLLLEKADKIISLLDS